LTVNEGGGLSGSERGDGKRVDASGIGNSGEEAYEESLGMHVD